MVGEQTGRVFLPKTPEAFTYDFDGNLTSDGRWIYTWDAENRLTAMEALASTPATAKQRLEFAYDGLGRRVQKKTYTWSGSAYQLAATTKFLYDGWNLLAEMNADNQLQRTYLWGSDLSGTMQGAGGVGGLLAVTDHTQPTAESHFVAYDGNGNVAALVKATDGSVSAQYEYGPFGEPIKVTGAAIAKANPIRWSSKYTDEESGLSYYGFRYFQPITGRWINRDPIDEEGGINIYVFVNNTPLSDVDALGWVPTLGFKTILEPRDGKCGDFDWRIAWTITPGTKIGGTIIQTISKQFEIKDCTGKISDSHTESIQEKWPARAKVSTDNTSNFIDGDSFTISKSSACCAGKNHYHWRSHLLRKPESK